MDSVVVRVSDTGSRVAVAVERSGSGSQPLIAVVPLVEALGGRVSALPNSRFEVLLGAESLELVDGLPFARSGNSVHPLAVAPALSGGRLMVPPQFAREVLPRVVASVTWDRGSGELRLPTTLAAAPSRTPPQRGPVRAAQDDADNGDGPTVLPTIRGNDRDGAPRATPVSSSLPPAADGRPVRRYTIVVDAGHGGVDPGMTGPISRGAPRIQEKHLTLAVSRALQRELEERGHRVVMTRTRDTLIALSDRGRIANQNRGDLFLSVHVNAANPRWQNAGSARGFETYFLAEARTEDARRVEQMENDAVRFEIEDEVQVGDPLSFIVTDMQQNEHLRESSDLAAIVQRHLGRIHPGPNRGVKQAAFTVLISAFMPSVLIELGFGTNAPEAAWMSDSEQQARMARSLADAAEEYLANFERRAAQSP